MEDFPWIFHAALWKGIIEKDLQSRCAAGWELVNGTILTRNVLAKWRDMGWELTVEHFRAMGCEEEEEEEEDDWIEQMLEWWVNNVDDWAIEYVV